MPLDSMGSAPYEDQGPGILAAQPLTAPDRLRRDPEYWDYYYPHLERRLATLRAWRWTWWDQWMQLGMYFLPRRAKAWVVANSYNRGRYLNNAIVDSTGNIAAMNCASSMWSGLTNPARPWFLFAPAFDSVDLDEESKKWLTHLGASVMAVLSQSNFYSTMAQFFQDVTVFGSSPIIIYEDDVDVIRCFNPCAGEYFLGVGSRLSVDTLYREFTMTTIQMVEMFKLENCPESVRNLWRAGGGSLDQEFLVAHAIEPNYAVAGPRGNKRVTIVPPHFPYREAYWLRGRRDGWPLSLRGFYDKPFMAGRWAITSNDPYGRGPGMDALGDQRQVQLETLRKAEFIEKGVRPPMIADPSLKNEPNSIMPGMITFVNTTNGQRGFSPAYEVQAQWLQHLITDIKDVESRIKECFYIPQFMAITQMQGVQPRNELELTKRDLERLQVLGPVIELFENEVASPALQRVVNIMQKRGMIAPMPAGLQKVPLKIQYMSLMRLAQRAAESIAMKDGFVTMGTLSAAAKAAGIPDPIRTVDLDGSLRHYLDLNNYPLQFIYSKADVEKHDAMRLQMIEQQKQAQQISEATKPAVDAAKVLSQTEVGGGSYLNALLSGQTRPQ